MEAVNVQLLVQSSGKFLCVIWNLGSKTYPKFVTLRSFFKIFKHVKKIEKIKIGSKKSINSFEMETRISHLIIFWSIIICWQYVNNFSSLLLLKNICFFIYLW